MNIFEYFKKSNTNFEIKETKKEFEFNMSKLFEFSASILKLNHNDTDYTTIQIIPEENKEEIKLENNKQENNEQENNEQENNEQENNEQENKYIEELDSESEEIIYEKKKVNKKLKKISKKKLK